MDMLALSAGSEAREPAPELTRVLVIDDDESVSRAIQAILAGHGCEVVITSRAFDGIDALRRASFDVVIIDIFMPGLNGLDAIEHIRRESRVPIIATSGFRLRASADAVDYLGLAAQRGATLCMPKPFQPVQLLDAIERTRNLWPATEGTKR